jgi:hypothetical protein
VAAIGIMVLSGWRIFNASPLFDFVFPRGGDPRRRPAMAFRRHVVAGGQWADPSAPRRFVMAKPGMMKEDMHEGVMRKEAQMTEIVEQETGSMERDGQPVVHANGWVVHGIATRQHARRSCFCAPLAEILRKGARGGLSAMSPSKSF